MLFEVKTGDILKFRADVLALKYAQDLYGADRAAYERLMESRLTRLPLPDIGGFSFGETRELLGSSYVLFVGVVPLEQLDYKKIRGFGKKVLLSLSKQAHTIRHLALTIHGPGYGLDELEAFRAELAGLIDGISTGDYPPDLERISFVERNTQRAGRLQEALRELVPGGTVEGNARNFLGALAESPKEALRTAGYTSATKPHIFVAMPFAESMDDVFHYGVKGAVNAAGFLCERADLSTFTGDVMGWVRQRISSAALVIADLSSANPNVYLEVGYAWGCGRSTILLVKDTSELKFDVRGHRCLVYKSIKNLEELLTKELLGLADNHRADHN